jgi:four helix bundle protein
MVPRDGAIARRFPAMTPGLRDLKVWQESVALGGEVTRVVQRHARRETRELTHRLLGESLTLAAAVADGSACSAATDQRERFREARRALAAVETHLAIARHAELVPAQVAAQLGTRTQNVGRLLSGYLAYLDRQVEEEGKATGRPGARAD